MNIALDKKEEKDAMNEIVDRMCLAFNAPKEYRELRMKELEQEEQREIEDMSDSFFKVRLEQMEKSKEEALMENTEILQRVAESKEREIR